MISLHIIGAISLFNQYGTGVIHFIRFNCNGNEQNLTSCSQSVGATCTHARDVGVVCRGNICLSHSHNMYMYHNQIYCIKMS